MLGRPGTSIQLLNVSDWSQIEIVFDLNLLTRLIFLIFWQVVAGVGEVEERRIYLGGGRLSFIFFFFFVAVLLGGSRRSPRGLVRDRPSEPYFLANCANFWWLERWLFGRST